MLHGTAGKKTECISDVVFSIRLSEFHKMSRRVPCVPAEVHSIVFNWVLMFYEGQLQARTDFIVLNTTTKSWLNDKQTHTAVLHLLLVQSGQLDV